MVLHYLTSHFSPIRWLEGFLASQNFIDNTFDNLKTGMTYFLKKFCINFVVWLLEFNMSLEPEAKPLGKESKECGSRMQLSSSFTFLPLLGIFSSDPAQVTALAVCTSWRQLQNSWLLSFKDLC